MGFNGFNSSTIVGWDSGLTEGFSLPVVGSFVGGFVFIGLGGFGGFRSSSITLQDYNNSVSMGPTSNVSNFGEII